MALRDLPGVPAGGVAEDVGGIAAVVTHTGIGEPFEAFWVDPFRGQHGPLGVAAESVVADVTVAAHDPMAGNE